MIWDQNGWFRADYKHEGSTISGFCFRTSTCFRAQDHRTTFLPESMTLLAVSSQFRWAFHAEQCQRLRLRLRMQLCSKRFSPLRKSFLEGPALLPPQVGEGELPSHLTRLPVTVQAPGK
eukprot:3707080-Amphidinium_carterae.1